MAIFKPIDEEPYAPNNPRGHQAPFGSPSFRPGILSGEVCVREVAAYLLDHKNFSKVPPTTFVEVIHQSLKYVPFTGMEVTTDTYMDIMKSLIRPVNLDETLFVTLNKTSESKDLSTSVSLSKLKKAKAGLKFGSLQCFQDNEGAIENFSSDMFSKDEVHKIAILDIRILNLDRNE